MQFSILKEDILLYLNYADKFTSKSNTLTDILQNIYIEADSETGKIILKTTNYEIGFQAEFNANIMESGATTVVSKTLLSFINNLPSNVLIDFSLRNNSLIISSKKIEFAMPIIDPASFPSVITVTPEYNFKIESKKLSTLFKRSYFCASTDITQKPEYTGVQLIIAGSKIELYATGLQRVAYTYNEIDAEYSNDFTINIPRKTIEEVNNIIDKNNCIVSIITDTKHISFNMETENCHITIFSKLIEKIVKNVPKLFASEYPIKAKINKNEFMENIKSLSVTTLDETPGIHLYFEDNTLTLKNLENVKGTSKSCIDNIEYHYNEPFDIILNIQQGKDILNTIDTEYFSLEMADKRSPVLISPDSDEYKYIVVPISIDRI